LKLAFIRTWHEKSVIPGGISLWRDKSLRTRFIGGAIITGLSITALAVCLPLSFLWAHDIFDFDFVKDHFVGTLTVLILLAGVSFFGLMLVATRFLLPTSKARRKTLLDVVNRTVVAGLAIFLISVPILLTYESIRYEQSGNLAVSIAVGLFMLLFATRWFVTDPVSSNYLTAATGLGCSLLVVFFPYHAAVAYQRLALRPFGISGVEVRVSDDTNTYTSCLVLMSHKYLWLRDANEIVVVGRDRVKVTMIVTGYKVAQDCPTIRVLRERA
jgi:hypothetical protein